MIDYAIYNLIKILGFFAKILPVGLTFFLGRRLGDILYYFDIKHKAVAYSNIKMACGSRLSTCNLSKLTHEFYRTFGQNLIEIFLIPSVNKKYLDKYIKIEGLENIFSALKEGKGVILLGAHAGSWELSNIICSYLGFPFNLLVGEQLKYPRVAGLLNSYRIKRGCKIINRQGQTKKIIEALSNNETIGMTIDQGGKNGILVDFFGRSASMSTGAVRLALKYGCAVIPVLFLRLKGPYIKITIKPSFKLDKTNDSNKDIQGNLQKLISIFEKHIAEHPKEYLWTYKIWKYSDTRNILVLNDGRVGHLRQSQAVADIVMRGLEEKGIKPSIVYADIRFKKKVSQVLLGFEGCFSGKYRCQGCLWCLRRYLSPETYSFLTKEKVDVVISCGSSVSAVNFLIARENLAKSIVILKPSTLGMGRFDLVIMPRHDKPPKRRNVVVTEGALNLINEEYLVRQKEEFLKQFNYKPSGICIGLLVGGDAKNFNLKPNIVSCVAGQLKRILEKSNAELLITTSRRTPQSIENLVKSEFNAYQRCKIMIVANEKNYSHAVGGILSLSQIILTSPESISMISEAVSSGKHVVVFKAPGLDRKHRKFLDYFAKKKYIYLTKANSLESIIEKIRLDKPEVNHLKDTALVREAIEKII